MSEQEVGGAGAVASPPTNQTTQANNALTLADLIPHIEQVVEVTIPDAVEAFEDDPEPLVYLLRVLQISMAKLKDAYELVEDALVEAFPEGEKEHFFDGVGTVTRRSGSRRTAWDHDALWQDLVPAIVQKLAKGGIQPNEVMPNFIAELRKAVTPSWKVTGLRLLGLDPEEYCETSWGRKTIQLPPVVRSEDGE